MVLYISFRAFTKKDLLNVVVTFLEATLKTDLLYLVTKLIEWQASEFHCHWNEIKVMLFSTSFLKRMLAVTLYCIDVKIAA